MLRNMTTDNKILTYNGPRTYNLYFETTQIILGEKSWNLSSVFLMFFSKFDRNMVEFSIKKKREN